MSPEKILWSVSALESIYDDQDELLQAAATIEPSTITYHGLFGRGDGVWPEDYHVYHGIGPIGLTGMNISRASGAAKVIAFEPSSERREIARKLGFEYVYNPIDVDPVETVNKVTGGRGADVHVETSGAVNQTYPVIEDLSLTHNSILEGNFNQIRHEKKKSIKFPSVSAQD